MPAKVRFFDDISKKITFFIGTSRLFCCYLLCQDAMATRFFLYLCTVKSPYTAIDMLRFLLSFLLLLSLPCGAEPVLFRHWTSSDGLADDCVRALSLGGDGRLWLRTPGGVSSFDGSRFRAFTLDVRRVYRWGSHSGNVYRDYLDVEGLLWMKSPGYMAVFDTRRERYIDDVAGLLARHGIRRPVDDLFVDGSGGVLYVVRGGELRYWDVRSHRLHTLGRHPRGARPLEMATVGGVLHILCADGRMLRWNCVTRSFVATDMAMWGRVTTFSARVRMRAGSDGALWLSLPSALLRRDPATAAWHEVWRAKGSDGVVTDLTIAYDGTAWFAASKSGLWHVAPRTLVATQTSVALPDGGAVSDPIQCLLTSAGGGLWTGHLAQGLCFAHPRMFPFRLVATGMGQIHGVQEEADGQLLVGTSTCGVVRYNPATGGVARAFTWLPEGESVLCLYRDTRRRLWVGTFGSGFYVWDGHGVKHFDAMFPAGSQTDHIARAVYDDGYGHLFVSVGYGGVGLLDEHTGRVTQLARLCKTIPPQRRDYAIQPVGRGLIAVFGDQGLYYYYVSRRKATVVRNDLAADTRHYGNYTAVFALLHDTRGLTWTATDNGLRVWDARQHTLRTLSTADGLYDNHISALTEDRDGRLWAMSATGMNCITLARGDDGVWRFTVRAFGRQSGLWGGRGSDGAMATTATGDIYAGAELGLYRFQPTSVLGAARSRAAVLLTDIEIGNRRLVPGEEVNGHTPLAEPLTVAREVRLRYDENFITLRFARPDFEGVSRHHYRYRLRGVDAEWVDRNFDGEGFATYTALAPGTYIFEVAAADGKSVETTVRVVISPPWYWSWPALLFYALLAAALAWWLWRQWRGRQKARRMIAEMRQRERQREEMNEMKFRFFTNVSHEFRTPLTLIMTPLSRLLATEVEPLHSQLQRIYDNADHLLQLINRLLDFRRVEMGGETLRPSRCEVVRLVRLVAEQFADVCQGKGIDMTVSAECGDDLAVWLDQNKLRHVLTNLYSNAIKFTPAGGSITTTVDARDGQLLITVADTGCGMEPDEAERVFERFYQAAGSEGGTGSGIGLHIAKRYIELHHGTITAESAGHDLGTTFRIAMPTEGVRPHEGDDVSSPIEQAAPQGPQQQRVLVVEDNAELRKFLADSLAPKYSVVVASDGEEGLRMAADGAPDIIVSDLMMPVMDGLAMCQRLKTDINTSHIPVIILTARASDEARIEGYKVGADSYIAKPFNYDVLETRIATLLAKAAEQRQRLSTAVARGVSIEPSAVTVTPVDEDYLRRALAAVEANIADTDFGATELGNALGMSRSQLYRKFESLAGIKPADFIRQVRLKRAAQLLRDSQLNISEIAYRTGFNFLRYFNQHFKEMYSMTPTEYRANNN